MRIYLIGFMGVGKSYLGSKLADSLNLPFFDIDACIEKSEQRSVGEIFTEKGEDYFRNLESKTLRSIREESVIATGGGIVESKENRNRLADQNNLVIWINPDWEVIEERLFCSDSLQKRPLLRFHTKTEINELRRKREVFYREVADEVFSGTSLDELLSLVSKYID